MPIKLPKGFARRKSSSNALEEVQNPPQSSFRVFERPSGDKKSFSDGNLVSKRLSEGQPLYSASEDDNNIFASHNRPQPARNLTFEGTSSARARPSTRRSTDGPQPEPQSPHTRNLYDIPIPPLSGAIRAAGRTFSFGGRFSKASAPTPPPQPSTPGPSRSRGMTTSTSSTATPPRLPDTELQVGKIEDDFQNMFGDIGTRYNVPKDIPRDRIVDPDSSGPPNRPDALLRKDERVSRPAPIDTDRSKEVEPSPYSWDSRHSEDGLLTTLDSPSEQPITQLHQRNPDTLSAGDRRKSIPLSNVTSLATTSHRSLEKPRTTVDKGLRRSGIYSNSRDSVPVEDEDAKLIMESLYTSKRGSQVPFMSDNESDAENDAPLFGHGGVNTAGPTRRESIPKDSLSSPGLSEHHLDPSIAAHARLAAQYEKAQPVSTSSSNKIMTPSQFEHYRQQQELRRSNSDASKSENSAESDYDEDDEVEKDREAERQRRKQEAHLSVYRQQMMKVTGQESPAPAPRPEMDQASKSAPNLLQPGNISGSGKSSDGDEDEEIPLGILAAHGFPNRNRPPSRLTPSSSIPNLRASFQQPYLSSPASVAERDPNNRGSLPIFARNLPRDPYFGASLVNSSNRESLALGGGLGGGGSVHGGPSPALPPGGLVGVIATEERARAMRRGSPNTQAMYDYQAGMSVPPVHPGGVPRPYTMMNLTSGNMANNSAAVSATEQAQIELSQQMTQMVQMQMQWMQQMIHMQGGQGTQLMPPGGPPPTLSAGINVRPSSMPSAGNMNNAPTGYQGDQRTLSMLDPNVSSRLNSGPMPYVSGGLRPSTPAGQGYAPSIAPSERSNVGLAPRYRPVSTIQPEFGTVSSPSMSKPWNDENRKSSFSNIAPAGSHMSRMTVRPTTSDDKTIDASKPNNGAELDDEDDDEGWAEMMKKRENKRNNWKMKKETSSFGDLLNAVH